MWRLIPLAILALEACSATPCQQPQGKFFNWKAVDQDNKIVYIHKTPQQVEQMSYDLGRAIRLDWNTNHPGTTLRLCLCSKQESPWEPYQADQTPEEGWTFHFKRQVAFICTVKYQRRPKGP